MAKKAYIGVDGKARKIKTGYIGVGGVACKIKKAYIGDTNGKARLCWSANLPAVGTALSDCTPEEIQAVAQAGLAASYFAVGDRVGITLNGRVGLTTFSNETYHAFILGFDHNSDIEGSNTIHFEIGKSTSGTKITFVDSNYGIFNSTAGFIMNTTNTNIGGWESSYMRTTICSSFKATMPTAWQNVIAPCTKYTDNSGGGSNTASYVTATSDEIWLLSECEVFGDSSGRNGDGYANDAEKNYQKQYDYYKNTASNSRKRKHNDTETYSNWFLRSVCVIDSSRWSVVHTGGNPSSGYANTSYGFSPCFIVA